MAQRKGRHAKPHRKKRLAWPSASSSGSPRGPSTVAQTAGRGGKRGPREDGRRPAADWRGRRPDSSSSGTPATLASIALFSEFTLLPLYRCVCFFYEYCYLSVGKIAKIILEFWQRVELVHVLLFLANLVLELSNLGSVISLIQTAVSNTVKSANGQWEKTHLPLSSSSAPFPPSEKKTAPLSQS